MRQFHHLTSGQISEIILSFHQGVSKAELARQFSVDHSTIHYHIAKYEQSYPEQGGIYAFIKVRVKKVCTHPSSRCTLCSEMWDQIRSAEREEIGILKRDLAKAKEQLRAAGYDVE